MDNGMCSECNHGEWNLFMGSDDLKRDRKRIADLVEQGHPEHCACRQVWGDGECECDLYKQGYDPYAWMKMKAVHKYGVVATPKNDELKKYPPGVFRKELIDKALHEAAKALQAEDVTEYIITLSITKDHNPLEQVTKFVVSGEIFLIKATINPIIAVPKHE
jgi:hypothetical protein